jgi:hypothetical protein
VPTDCFENNLCAELLELLDLLTLEKPLLQLGR